MIFILYNDDCIKVMNELPSSSVDMVFADPPYFLSNDGRSINSGKIVSVNKGEWDKRKNYDDINRFTFEWLKCCYRVLKSSGTIWVSGTMHNIFDVRDNMLKNGYRIINIIIWQKTDPPPLIYKNKFRFSYEFVIWAAKSKGYYFNYQAMYNIKNIEMSDVWVLPAVSNQEKKYGKHPTQKPECLIERIILSCTQENDTVLDPFMGSGTTCVVAKRLNRKFIGIEKEKDYFLIAHKRIIND